MKKKNQMEKETNKGITLIAIVITIIVLLILAAVSIATLTGKIKDVESADSEKEDEVTPVEFTKAQGKIDIIWVNKENQKIEKPLAPVLNGMKKVYWKDGEEIKEGDGTFTESE